MPRILLLFLAVFAAVSAFAAASGWSTVPLAQWTETNTVDPCTEGIAPEGMPKVIPADHRMPLTAPEPPFGAWQEQEGVLRATGLANCWSTMLLPGSQQGAEITTRFTVVKSAGYARQLPGGCVRWGFHWGENLPGWDIGVVVGYQDPLNFYRVQLSADRNELALWDATGGFLQLIPCKVGVGQPHELKVGWRGAHLLASLDGKLVMDYWDRTLPYLKGRVGLSVWKSETVFTQFTAGKAAAKAEKMPAHVTDFHFEPTANILTEHPGFHMTPRSGIILFDGREPISYFYKQELDKGGPMSYGSLIQEAVKLKPGYRAAYFNYIGPPGNDGDFPRLQGELPEAFHITTKGKVLNFSYQTLWKNGLKTDYTVTVRYDEARGVYRYEYKGIARAIAACTFNEFEFIDPYVFNNRTPGPEVAHTWNPAGHKWWVYQGKDGTLERFPLVDPLGHENAVGQWGKCNDFLYPDPAACPAFESELGWAQPKGRFYSLGQCTWGYDYHHREVGGRLNLNPGDERPFSFTCTALPPKEADALFAQSKVNAEIAADKKELIPFHPAGNSFAEVTTWQEPKYQAFWEGGTRDTTVGHGDAFALRLDGAAKAGLTLRQFLIEAHAKRWWVRGWVKTTSATAAGLTLKVAYPGYATDTVNLGAGDQEWTYFSFITDVFKVRDETKFTFELPGGTAWIDDIAVSALKDGENPKVTATPVSTRK